MAPKSKIDILNFFSKPGLCRTERERGLFTPDVIRGPWRSRIKIFENYLTTTETISPKYEFLGRPRMRTSRPCFIHFFKTDALVAVLVFLLGPFMKIKKIRKLLSSDVLAPPIPGLKSPRPRTSSRPAEAWFEVKISKLNLKIKV